MMRILSWFVPGGFLAAFTLALAAGRGSDWVSEALGGSYPWLVFAVVLLVGAFFHRSRVVLFVLGLSGLFLAHSGWAPDSTGFLVMGGLFALAMGCLSLSQDRGLFSSGGLLQTLALLVVFFFAFLLVEIAPDDFSALLTLDLFPQELSGWAGLPQPVFLVLAIAMPVTLLAAVVRASPVERALFWSLLMVAFALRDPLDSGAVGMFLTGAGLTLGLSVLQTSYAMAFKDDLTGLPARRALMRDLQGAGGVYATAMVDVDHFKRVNDRHGHDVGDQVLRMVASRLAKAPGKARAYRYGGEEFVLFSRGRLCRKHCPT